MGAATSTRTTSRATTSRRTTCRRPCAPGASTPPPATGSRRSWPSATRPSNASSRSGPASLARRVELGGCFQRLDSVDVVVLEDARLHGAAGHLVLLEEATEVGAVHARGARGAGDVLVVLLQQ